MATKKSKKQNASAIPDARLSQATANHILIMLADIKRLFENEGGVSSALRPSERRRFSSMGMQRAGFVNKVIELWRVNGQFTPSYATTAEMERMFREFNSLSAITTTVRELLDLVTDIRIQTSSDLFRLALSFYDNVQQAATVSRVTEAEAIYAELRQFFRSLGNRPNSNELQLTEEQFIADARAMFKGKKDGKLVVENELPKQEKGKHIVIDEIKDVQERGEITEKVENEEA